jgi:hypothetical protein
MLSKIWVWNPGSEIRDPEKTYSGSRIQGSKRHRIPDPQHCEILYLLVVCPMRLCPLLAEDKPPDVLHQRFAKTWVLRICWTVVLDREM